MATPAYFIIELQIHNSEKFHDGYGSKVGNLILRHGGKIIVPGNKALPVEGSAPKGIVIVVCFEHIESAQAFISDPDYQRIAPWRRENATTRSFLVEGKDFIFNPRPI
jgi:uncharacterized protein (DUF1330 family)